MSQTDIQRFNDEIAGNAGLQARIDSARTGKELVAIAKENGFVVTAADFQQFAESLAADELPQERLGQVTGGLSGTDLGSGRVVDSPRPGGLARKLFSAPGTVDADLLKSF